MGWFLYDIGLRHERVKFSFGNVSLSNWNHKIMRPWKLSNFYLYSFVPNRRGVVGSNKMHQYFVLSHIYVQELLKWLWQEIQEGNCNNSKKNFYKF